MYHVEATLFVFQTTQLRGNQNAEILIPAVYSMLYYHSHSKPPSWFTQVDS